MKVDFHFVMSMIKSILRIGACLFLVLEMLQPAGFLFLVAEIFGIIEEV